MDLRAGNPLKRASTAHGTPSPARLRALADRAGGLLMVGFDGTTSQDAPLEFVEGIAGAILFKRNLRDARQTLDLTEALQAAGRAGGARPLLIAIDQEGGSVSRLSAFGTTTPSAMALGAAGDPALTELVYRAVGTELRALGVNFDFAPVADINSDPANPVIGVRSFGDDPEAVALHVAAAVRGLRSARVAATAKHFPGHGDTKVDSHLDLPVLQHDLARLLSREAVPFRAAAAAGVEAIMTAHISFPEVEASGLPATMSPAILTGLLRQQLGYRGVICTDCMEMSAVAARYGAGEAACAAVSAGADLVLFSHSGTLAREAVNGLRAAIFEGRLDADQIELSLSRIEALRDHLGAFASGDLDQVGSSYHRRVAIEAALRCVTCVRDPQRVLPLRCAHGDRILVVQFVGDAMSPVEGSRAAGTSLGKRLESKAARVHEQFRSLDPAGHEYKQLLMAAGTATAVVAVTRRAAQHPLQARAVADLAMLGKPLVVVAAREPYDACRVPPEVTVLAAYGDDDVTMEAVAEFLLGPAKPVGRLPVRLPPVAVST
ncbi:MAG: hypothetical protein GIW99_07630 [Candidatus Eremiobacteraeota bacterium]|nr:hypothetical protein [Candidatus Eremiobacteraeota bacterium]